MKKAVFMRPFLIKIKVNIMRIKYTAKSNNVSISSFIVVNDAKLLIEMRVTALLQIVGGDKLIIPFC